MNRLKHGAMGIIAAIFFMAPAWSGPADCPPGASQEYCEIAKATGGFVVACDAKIEGQKACMDKFNNAMEQAATRDKAKAERERLMHAEESKRSREDMLKTMPDGQRQAYLDYEQQEQKRRALRQMGLGLFALSVLGFLASFGAWLAWLGKEVARRAGMAVGAWLAAAGLGAMMEVGMIGMVGTRGGAAEFGLIAVAIPSVACALACVALAKGEVGKSPSWGRRGILALGALLALAAGLLPGVLGVVGMMH